MRKKLIATLLLLGSGVVWAQGKAAVSCKAGCADARAVAQSLDDSRRGLGGTRVSAYRAITALDEVRLYAQLHNRSATDVMHAKMMSSLQSALLELKALDRDLTEISRQLDQSGHVIKQFFIPCLCDHK